MNTSHTPTSFRVIRSVIRKDILEWLHQPRQIIVTILPTFGLLFVLILGAAAVGHNKVALVVLSTGPHTDQMVQAIEKQNAFVITRTTNEEADTLIKSLKIEAVITIPADFESRFMAGQTAPIDYEVNNLNLDFTNDLRRSLPDAITTFYASQPKSPITVSVNENDLRLQDIDQVQFQVLPLLVQLLTAAGVLNTGLAAAREWETLTIKELYQAPINRRDLIIGKTMAGWLITMFYGIVALVIANSRRLFPSTGDLLVEYVVYHGASRAGKRRARRDAGRPGETRTTGYCAQYEPDVLPVLFEWRYQRDCVFARCNPDHRPLCADLLWRSCLANGGVL